MNLVIVESPTKAKTIGKFLGSDFEIKASMGHVMDLPKSKLGVDTDDNFTPQYEVSDDKKKIISELKKAAKDAKQIILATDPDREGEAIASHVKDMLNSSSKFKVLASRRSGQSSKFQRIVFHEITKEAIEEAFKNPRVINENLVNAQTARRVLDRLVGYKLSPLLWQKVRRGLSAGRVQSVALRLIVEREREIEKFEKEKYWTIHVFLRSVIPNSFRNLPSGSDEMLKPASTPVSTRSIRGGQRGEQVQHDNKEGTEFELIEINGEKIEAQKACELYDGKYTVSLTSITTEQKAKEIAQDLKTKQYVVQDVLKKETKRSPQPPHTTSTLQQDAARRLGFSGKRTMSLAQKLYEEGFITYHRTDSVVLASSAIQAIRGFVQKTFGEKYIPSSFRFYTTKQKLAQEAHEAIRPTSLDESSKFKVQSSKLGRDYGKLYDLIWQRAVASQMSDAIIESTTVLVNVIPNSFRDLTQSLEEMLKQVQHDKERIYTLRASGSVLVFDGFLKVNPFGLQDTRLPDFSAKQNVDLKEVNALSHETPPPPRYNYASLVSTLEEKGIGRPSTYAPIISTIEDRQYVLREPPTGAGRFIPTSIGIAVNDFLVGNFSDIDDVPFTASMEDEFDAIAQGEKDWVPVMKNFYAPFEKKLGTMKNVERVKIEVEQTNEKCPECDNFLVIRLGRFGKFLSCSTFPNCKFTKPFVEKTDTKCPKCNGDVVIKRTKKGRVFYGCSNYPKCDFAAWKLKDISKTKGKRVID